MIHYCYKDAATDRNVTGNAHHVAVHYTADQIYAMVIDREGRAEVVQVIDFLSPPQEGTTHKFVCDRFTIEG